MRDIHEFIISATLKADSVSLKSDKIFKRVNRWYLVLWCHWWGLWGPFPVQSFRIFPEDDALLSVPSCEALEWEEQRNQTQTVYEDNERQQKHFNNDRCGQRTWTKATHQKDSKRWRLKNHSQLMMSKDVRFLKRMLVAVVVWIYLILEAQKSLTKSFDLFVPLPRPNLSL